jgi:hypothetical protein
VVFAAFTNKYTQFATTENGGSVQYRFSTAHSDRLCCIFGVVVCCFCVVKILPEFSSDLPDFFSCTASDLPEFSGDLPEFSGDLPEFSSIKFHMRREKP